jgi:hypothetical protein
MEKHSEHETKKTLETTGPADGALSEAELDAVSGGDESPKETVTFEYGGLLVHYEQQKPNG